jgi:pSer/pThr/pTyr-binding forkhead associated (FHA) protein
MKLSLKVLTPGKWVGKTLPISHFPFLIGRDGQCHLRPASEIISKRHCGLFIKDGQVLLRDFDSTNGTFLNNRQVKGQIEVLNGDHINLGVLQFAVQLEAEPSRERSTSLPATKDSADTYVDDLAATLLLSNPDPADASRTQTGVTYEVAQEDNGFPSSVPSEASRSEYFGNAASKLSKGATAMEADTAIAAKAILDKYVRSRRSHN